MDVISVLSPGSSLKHTPPKKLGGGNCNDIWAAVRNGSVQDVELALASMKKCNGNVDARSVFGSTALHIAVWRNHIPIVRLCLQLVLILTLGMASPDGAACTGLFILGI